MNGIGILIILLVALSVLLIIAIVWLFGWRSKYNEAIKSWGDESDSKDEQIFKLQEELKNYKDMERVIKVERVTIQPRELECKFMLHERFVDDTDLFKKVITSEVARYMAEELNKDPYLCKLYFEQNPINFHEWVKVRFRMLPYAEGVVWDDILKEEKPRTLHDLYPKPDFSKFKEEK